jgi:hypothetical protein
MTIYLETRIHKSEPFFSCVADTLEPATPHFAYALKVNRLRTWRPGMTATIHKQILLNNSGDGTTALDLFDFSFRLISYITSRVLLGENVVAGNDRNMSEKWIQLVNAAEPDKIFDSGIVHSIRAIGEVAIFGELRAYPRARELIMPYIDVEIERCIRGEPEWDDFPVLGALVRSLFKQGKNDPEKFFVRPAYASRIIYVLSVLQPSRTRTEPLHGSFSIF